MGQRAGGSRATLTLWGLLAALSLGAACSPVRATYTRADYLAEDVEKTVRISVVVAPRPAGEEAAGKLWAAIARTYINQHRDFIVVEDYTEEALPEDVCSGDLEGYLHLAPTLRPTPEGASAQVRAELRRCRDRELVWWAEAAGSWAARHADLESVRAHWVKRFGEVVDAIVVPSYRLLTGTFEVLPRPRFPSEAYIREKIQLGE
jgi:probable lipoprotein (TIGR04455 family)